MTRHPIAFDREPYIVVKRAVDALAGVCDGAEQHDDQGFDGSDARMGHLLAYLPLAAWPLAAFHRAWKWTKKYQRQLLKMGVATAELPEPPAFAGEDRQLAQQSDGSGWLVVFPYDPELIAAFRRIPGGALHTHRIGSGSQQFRTRTVQPVAGAQAALLTFARAYEFQLAPGVEALVQETQAEAYHPYRITLETPDARTFALYFPGDSLLNEQVKAIPGKAPAYSGGFHWIIPATALTAFKLQNFLDRNPQFFVPAEAQARLDALMEEPFTTGRW